MQPFVYERPATLAEAVALLAAHGSSCRVLAGGTDLIIRLRDGSARPAVVVDVKRIAELRPAIREAEGRISISATTVMTDVAADGRIRRHFAALAEAAAVVGSVQIRNRATLAGNVCNASPAADTAPALLVFGAEVVAAGPTGIRRLPLDELFVRSGVTTLAPGELVTAIELPIPARRTGSTHVRRTRRRGLHRCGASLHAGAGGNIADGKCRTVAPEQAVAERCENGAVPRLAQYDGACDLVPVEVSSGEQVADADFSKSPGRLIVLLAVSKHLKAGELLTLAQSPRRPMPRSR
jgi:carbon-monoxide dehydrogenase medium subunit